MTITLQLSEQAIKTLKQRAEEAGCQSIDAYLEAVAQQSETPEETPEQWIDRITGTATSGLTTDEIMAMTRSEV
jgi:hypothetical protein